MKWNAALYEYIARSESELKQRNIRQLELWQQLIKQGYMSNTMNSFRRFAQLFDEFRDAEDRDMTVKDLKKQSVLNKIKERV